MSPAKRNVSINDGVYSAILALAALAVAGTLGFVIFKCMSDYETVFKIVGNIL